MMMKYKTLIRAERPTGVEARAINRQIYKKALSTYQDIEWQSFLQEMNLWILESALNSVIYGWVVGKKNLQKELKFALEDRISRMFDAQEYETLRMYFENEASQLSNHLRKDLGSLLADWSKVARFEGYTTSQAAESLRQAFRIKGYSLKNARNITTIFRTGFYAGLNGVTYVETRNNPEVWGYRYVTAGDEKVRVEHAAQNGVTLPKDDPYWAVWWPPNGYNCRCRIEVLTNPANRVEADPEVQPDQGFSGNPFIGL